jgi:nucleoside-diphosphate-sugar epimerase
MKKVLILGGGGFIGINIARTLSERKDCAITIADLSCHTRLNEYFPSQEDKECLTLIEDDFTKPEAYQRLDTDYDELYMMAAIVGVNNTLERPDEVIRVNTALTFYTIEWLKQSNVKKVLFASSSECYVGATDVFDYKIPTPETVPLCIEDIAHPRFTYAVTKMHGESAFLNCARMMDMKCTIVRYQNIFGPNMGFKHVIPHLVQRFHENESPFKIYGHDQTRAFCYIDDGVNGTIKAMESKNSDQEVYHIGNTEEISMETLTKFVGDIMGYTGEYIPAPTYPGSVARRCPDITKSREHLNYEPQVHWTDGVKLAVAWYKDFFESGIPLAGSAFEPPEKFSA